MWNLILLVLTVLSVIWTWRLINFAIRTANRIAVATETSSVAMQTLCDSLSDEAKQRANAVWLARKSEAQEANIKAFAVKKQNDALTVRAIGIVACVLVAFFIVLSVLAIVH